MKQAMREGTGADYELRTVGADSVLRHIHLCTEILTDEAGGSIGSHGTLTDITQRVIAMQEQTKFVSLIENSSDFIAMASLDGALLSMNPAGRQLVGLERGDEITGRLLSDFMPTGVWEWMMQRVLPIVMSEGRWDGECQLVHETTGNAYDMQASYFLIRKPVSGEPMCLATVQRDITAAKWQDGQFLYVSKEVGRNRVTHADAVLMSLIGRKKLPGGMIPCCKSCWQRKQTSWGRHPSKRPRRSSMPMTRRF